MKHADGRERHASPGDHILQRTTHKTEKHAVFLCLKCSTVPALVFGFSYEALANLYNGLCLRLCCSRLSSIFDTTNMSSWTLLSLPANHPRSSTLTSQRMANVALLTGTVPSD